MAPQKKLVIVGDNCCDKNYLPNVFTQDTSNTEYNPTVFENYVADIDLGDTVVELSLWDTSGQEDCDGLRPIQYSETDVVLICFSVMSKDSLNNVTAKWYPEVKYFCPDVPILVIGTHCDSRDDLEKIKQETVMREEAERVAKAIGAVLYIECSAKTKFNVRKVFAEAARAAIEKKKKRYRHCLLI